MNSNVRLIGIMSHSGRTNLTALVLGVGYVLKDKRRLSISLSAIFLIKKINSESPKWTRAPNKVYGVSREPMLTNKNGEPFIGQVSLGYRPGHYIVR